MKQVGIIDQELFHHINEGTANTFFDILMPALSARGYLLLIPFVVYMFWRARTTPLTGWSGSIGNAPNRRKGPSTAATSHLPSAIWAACITVFSFLMADWMANELKHLIERVRPCTALEGVRLLVGCSGSWSMPSGHAANSFAYAVALMILTRDYMSLAWRLWPMALAVFVSFSRVYVGVHYPGDVIAGAALGSCIAFTLITCFNFAKKRYQVNPHATVLVSTLVAISLFRIFYILHGPLDLSPDEAHYWEWSRRLDLSYYSKGPAIAYLIHLGTSLFGDTEFGIRFMAIIFSALGSFLLFRLVRLMCGDSLTALYTAVLFQIIPLYAAFGVIFTIDSPFLLFWIVSLLLMWRAVSGQQSRNETSSPEPGTSVTLWIALGVSLGLGLLTKYTMAFFAVAAFLFLVFSERRSLLKTAGPYLTLVISAAIFSPVVLWNMQHEWITLKHTAGQAHIAEGFSLNLKYFFEFLGSQAGVITPILFVMMWYGLYRYGSRENHLSHRFLLWFSLPIVVFFILKSLQGKVQANWAMMGYITGMIPLAHMAVLSNGNVARAPRPEKTITRAGIVLALLITMFSYSAPALGILPPSLDPSARLRGWKELGKEISRIRESLPAQGNVLLFSDSYQVASEMAFYVRGHPVTYCINLGRRMNQYDLWPDINKAAQRIRETGTSPAPINAIYVRTGNRSMQAPVEQAFDSCERNTLRVVQRGHLIREYSIFVCYNFRGLKTEPSTTY